jgi:hypothetical protein
VGYLTITIIFLLLLLLHIKLKLKKSTIDKHGTMNPYRLYTYALADSKVAVFFWLARMRS